MRNLLLKSKSFLVVVFSILSFQVQAQFTDSVVYDFGGAPGGCAVCGSGYSCMTNYTPGFNDANNGKRLINLKFKVFYTACANGTYYAVLNGDTMGSFNAANNCSCGSCFIDSVEVTNLSKLNAYKIGQSNTLNLGGVYLCIDKIMMIRTFAALTPDNAGVMSIDSPKYSCPGAVAVKVTIANNGTTRLDSVQVHWTYNGVSQTMYHHKSVLDTIGGAGSRTAQVTLGTKTLVNGKIDTLVVWTSMPNGKSDTVNYDDTLRAYLLPSVSDTFTVGGTSPDFSTIQDAVNYLQANGLCGPVVLNLRPTGFYEQVILPPVPGSSSTNTITIRSESGDSTASNVYFVPSSSTTNFIFKFMTGASNYRLSQFTVEALSASYGRLIWMEGQNNNIQINNCRLKGYASTSTSSFMTLIHKPSVSNSPLNNFRVMNNRFEYGSVGIWLEGPQKSNLVYIENNDFYRQHYQNAILLYVNGLFVRRNDVERTTGSYTYAYGFQMSQIDSGEVSFNRIDLKNSGVGLYMYLVNGTTMNPFRVYNNMISVNYSSDSYANAGGAVIESCNRMQFFNNSCYGRSLNGDQIVSINYGTNVELKYNSLMREGGGVVLSANGSSSNFMADYNNYFHASMGDVCRLNSTLYRSLTSWISATGDDSMTRTGNPYYISSSDLHSRGVDLNERAKPVSYIGTDIDGETRHATRPDIGADEFSIPPDDAGIVGIDRFMADSICVIAHLKNFGSDTLKSVTLNWSVNGSSRTPVSWTGAIPSGDSLHVCLGYQKFVTATLYDIKVFSSSPNGKSDTLNFNDTFSLSSYPVLNGVYTIGGSSPDFSNITNAVTALNTYGIMDSVRFRIRNGTYNEQFNIDEVDGAIDENDIVFESEAMDSSKVVISYSPSWSYPYVAKVFNTSGVTFRHLTFRNTNSSSPSRVFMIEGEVSDINIENNRIFSTYRNGSSVYDDALIYSDYQAVERFNILRNYFTGGAAAFYNYNDMDVEFSHNMLDSQYAFGYYASSTNGEYICGNNTIIGSSTYSNYYGIYIDNLNGNGRIYQNKIYGHDNKIKYGIYLNNHYQNVNSDSVHIYNNFISAGMPSTSSYGIYIDYTDACNIVYNNILNHGSDTANSRALFVYNSDYLNILNNNLVNSLGGFPMQIDYFDDVFSNFNNLYSPNGAICQFNFSDYYSLSDWMATDFDTNSVSLNPLYTSNSDLHVGAVGLDKKARIHHSITTDIDGETRSTSTPDIGADEFVPPTLDIAVAEFLSPGTTIKPDSIQIKVVVLNLGVDTVTTFKVGGLVNQTSFSVITVNKTLNPGDTTHVILGGYKFKKDSVNNIACWTQEPNNTTDQKKSNDTLRILNRKTAMSGVYTIGGSSPDFPGFIQAINAMEDVGIADSVRFRVRAGTYTERLRIEPIAGAGARNSIVFESENLDSSSVLLTSNTTQFDSNYVVFVAGGDGITFRNITIQAIGTSYGTVMRFDDNASFNTVSRCHLKGVSTTNTSSNRSVIESENSNSQDENNWFIENRIDNGSFGFYWYGYGNSGDYYEEGNRFEGNLMNGQYYHAIYVEYQENTHILNNKVTNTTGHSSSARGIGFYNAEKYVNVSGNHIIRTFNTDYGMLLGSMSLDSGLISNNMIDVAGSSSYTGLYLEYVYNTLVAHNTVRMKAGSGLAFYCYYGTDNRVYNNIFEHEGTGRAMYMVTSGSVDAMDYNNYRNKVAPLLYFSGTNYNTLSDYQAVTVFDSSSLSANPEFKGTNDLHIGSFDLNESGIPLAQVPFDFDGDARDTLRPDIGADEIIPAPIDAGISAIITPYIPFLSDSQEVKVVIRNFGNSVLSSAIIEWTLNGVSGSSYNFSGSLGTGDTAHVRLGKSYFHRDSSYNLICWTRLPNSQNDTVFYNDTAKALNQYPALKGVYTIGGASPDFANFTDAVNALKRGGMIDTVVFNVRNGSYVEQLSFTGIVGASQLHDIVFQSESGDSSLVILNYTAQNSSANYVIKMEGTKGITFRNLTISGGNSSYSSLVNLSGNNQDLVFTNNRMYGVGSSITSSNHCGFFIQTSVGNNHSIQIHNNDISGISYGIYHSGSYSSIYDRKHKITGNIIKPYYMGWYTYYCDTCEFKTNRVESGSYTSAYGILGYYTRYCTITGNNVQILSGGRGIYLESSNSSSVYRGLLANNMVYIGGNNGNYGIYTYYSNYLDIYYNTVHVPSTNTSAMGIYLYYGGNYRVVNNISKTGNGYAYYIPASGLVSESNHNCYHVSGSNFTYWNGNRATLTDLRTANGMDASSVSTDPMFVSNTDLHIRAIDLDGKGKVLSNLTTDFDSEVRDSIKPDIGADEFKIPGPDDAGISAFAGPVAPFVSGTQPVKVILSNYGSDTLKSVTVAWTMNGVSQTAYAWTGSIPSGKKDTITLGNYTFTSGVSHTLVAFVQQPNGKPDTLNYNDTLTKGSIYSSLAGIYTIGGTLPDFNTFQAAIGALSLGGISDSVTFKVRNGTYTEQLTINSYAGANVNKPVTFISESGDSSKVILKYYSTLNNANHVVLINGADQIRFRKMSIVPESYYYGHAVRIEGQAINCEISNCRIINSGPEYYYSNAAFYSSSDQDNNLRIEQNTISNFYYATLLYGSSGSISTYENGLKIIGNLMDKIGAYGFYIQYQKNCEISGNRMISSRLMYNGIRTYQTAEGMLIKGNKFSESQYSNNVFYLGNHVGNSTSKCQIFNNFISNSYGSGNGIYVEYSSYVDIDFNSILMYSASSTGTSAIRMLDAASYNIRNNNMLNKQGGYSFYTNGTLPSVCNYNNLYTTGSTLVYQAGINRANLVAWNGATGRDANSKSIDPIFYSNTDLHTTYIGLDSMGTYLSTVTTDIDGDARNTVKPDIGADEFNSLPDNLGITAILNTSMCEMDSQFVQVRVFNFGSNKQWDYKLKFHVNGGNVDSLQVNDTILPGQSKDYSFQKKYPFTAYQAYLITAWSQLAAEAFTGNDTARSTITNYQSAQSVGSMIPADSSINLDIPLSLSWSPATGATMYDVYIWPDSVSTRPSSPYASNITQISISINSGLGYGHTYKWQVVSKNPVCSQDGDVQIFTMRNLPDLQIQSISAPVSAFSGNSVSLSWVTKNIGLGTTGSGQWYELVYLSSDKIYDGSDLYVSGVLNTASLGAGQSYSNGTTVNIPNGYSGKYYFLVRTNPYSGVLESDMGNNIRSDSAGTNITLTPPPDLQVVSVTRPSIAFSGTSISFQFTVKNKGTGETRPGNWRDYIYLSTDTVFNGSAVYKGNIFHSGSLEPDSQYTVSATLSIPVSSSGPHYIYVRTDNNDEVYEHANNNNNTGRSDSIHVVLTPPPDLIVSGVSIKDTNSIRENTTIEWDVVNQGGSATTSGWYDVIYFSANPVFSTLSAQHVGSAYHSYLDAGDTIHTVRNVTIPDNYTGTYYVFVLTDFYNAVFEDTEDTNNTGRNNFFVHTPDLQVPQVVAPSADSSGKTISISWKVYNNGPGELFTAWRSDRIYISAKASFNADSSTLLGTNSYTTAIPSGDTITRTASVTIPNGTQGTQYIYVFADADLQILEVGKEGNNTGRSDAMQVTLSPYPEMIPTSITTVDSSEAGQYVKVKYTIKNQGEKTASPQWKDRLYLSRDSVFNLSKCIVLGTNTRLTSTGSQESYIDSSLVLIPGTVSAGQYFFYVHTDFENKLYEYVYDTNNIRRTGKVYIDGYPPVDLDVITFNSQDSAYSGDSIAVSWQVKNIGEAATLADYWFDRMYLSTDSVLDGTDVQFGEVQINSDVAANESYTVSSKFFVPNGTTGHYYLILISDISNANNDVDTTNNLARFSNSGGMAIPVVFTLSPFADLKFTTWSIPSTATGGQPVKVVWEVKNDGNGSTKSSYWIDRIYLSTDFVIDGSDPWIGSKNQFRTLAVGQSYKDSGEFTLPTGISGNRIILVKTDDNNREYEHNQEANNQIGSAITISNAPPSDLVVTSISSPGTALSGAEVNLSYTIKNKGSNPVNGYLRTNVYISTDSFWDAGDLLFQTSNHYVNLVPSATETRNVSGTIGGVALGEYYFVVYTDILNNINESNDTNNTLNSFPISISVPELPMNTLVPDSILDNKAIYYRLVIPDSLDGESVMITLKGDSINGSNEIYTRFNAMPTKSSFDFAYSDPFEGNQELLIPEVQVGTYYIMVEGETTVGDKQYISLYARKLEFEIREVSPTSGGNTGTVTLRVKGSKFDEFTSFQLLGESDTINSVEPDSLVDPFRSSTPGSPRATVTLVDPTLAFVSFDLRGVAIDTYDVVASKGIDERATLEDGFRVVAGGPADIQINVVRPSNTRTNAIISFRVEFTNSGNTDLVNKSLRILSNGGAAISLTPEGLSANATVIDAVMDEENGPPGILRPAGSGSIIVYTNSTTALGISVLLPN